MHQNATVAQSIVASCFRFDGAAQPDRAPGSRFSDESLPLRGLPPLRRRDRLRAVGRTRSRRRSIGCSTRSTSGRCSCRSRSCCSGAAASRTCAPVVERAHAVGAHVVLDVYQGAGTVPMNLAALERGLRRRRLGEVAVRRARRRLSLRPARSDVEQLEPAIVGWAGHAAPFDFETGAIRYADAVERFQSGTPNVPSLYSARAGYEIVGEIGVPAIREKSLRLTRRLIDAAGRDGWRLNTPSADHERGGSVVIDVPHGARRHRRAARAPGHRRLPPERRHPHGAALLQHGSGDRSRDRRDERSCQVEVRIRS